MKRDKEKSSNRLIELTRKLLDEIAFKEGYSNFESLVSSSSVSYVEELIQKALKRN